MATSPKRFRFKKSYRKTNEFPDVGTKEVRVICYHCQRSFTGPFKTTRAWFATHRCEA